MKLPKHSTLLLRYVRRDLYGSSMIALVLGAMAFVTLDYYSGHPGLPGLFVWIAVSPFSINRLLCLRGSRGKSFYRDHYGQVFWLYVFGFGSIVLANVVLAFVPRP